MADRTFKSFKDFPIELRPTNRRPAVRNELVGSDETAQIQQFVERLSRMMDSAFEVPVVGWRFGWDALIG